MRRMMPPETDLPRVSVIIAAYKASPYLSRALQSVAAQSFTQFEALVCDDSNDSAVQAIVDSVQDPRFVYRPNRVRLGVARNYWNGIAASRGTYIAILNHDDRLDPDHLQALVAPLEADATLCVAFSDHDIIDADDHVLSEATEASTDRWQRRDLRTGCQHRPAEQLMRQSIPMAIGPVFRRDAILLSDLADVGPAYDLWLGYLLARSGRPLWYDSRRLASWRVHATQITATGDEAWTRGAYECWKAIASDLAFQPVSVAGRKALASAALRMARHVRSRGDLQTVWYYTSEAVRTMPFSLSVWLRAFKGLLQYRSRHSHSNA
jgi:glycosyltransferase involved in cell wall biosynthesis